MSIGNDDIPTIAPGQESDGADLFMKHLQEWGKDEETPSKPQDKPVADKHPTKDEEAPEEEVEAEHEDEETPSEGDEETTDEEGETEEEDEPERSYTDDDKFVKIKVGDEEQDWSVKDLKRLAGQESSLTKKGQELSQARLNLETEQQVTTVAQNHLLEAARKRFEPYAKLDFLSLSRDPSITKEHFQALREETQARFEELNFLENQAREYTQGLVKQQQALAVEEAKTTVAALTSEDSPYRIEGWNQGMYDELRSFAVSKGVPAKIVNSIISAPIVKLIHDAMLFSKGAAIKEVKTVKVNKSVKKVIKTSHSPSVSRQAVGDKTKFGDKSKAMANLKRSGSMKSAEDAFMASFREFETE